MWMAVCELTGRTKDDDVVLAVVFGRHGEGS
jgi:hypothetical protein